MKKITEKTKNKNNSEKLKYSTPKLNFFGKLSKITLAGATGLGESGNTTTKFDTMM